MNEEPIIVAGFPIDGSVSLRKWMEFEDVRYLVVNHGRGDYRPLGTWCYYVQINELQLPAEQFDSLWLTPSYHERSSGRKEASYDYNAPAWADADWHGGVTYYEKSGGIDEQPRSVRIGCDFAHLWDEGREYDFADVQREALQTIVQLRGMFTFYRRCPWNGRYLPAEQMVEIKGRLYSPDGAAKMNERSPA